MFASGQTGAADGAIFAACLLQLPCQDPPHDRRTSRRWAPAGGPVLAVVGNCFLDRLSAQFVLSHPGSRAVSCSHPNIVGFVDSNAVDLVLLDIDASSIAGFSLAAHVRAAVRARHAGGYTVLVAATSSECKYLDCLVGGSAINGVLKMPCDVLQFADLVDLWCPAVRRRVGSCQ